MNNQSDAVLYQHFPGFIEGNYENLSQMPVSEPKFEPGTSQTPVRDVQCINII
jgi:hypothetical protein